MKQGIFRRVFIFYAVILLVSILFVEVYVTGVIRKSTIENLRKDLTTQAILVAGKINFKEVSGGADACGEVKRVTASRITIIAADGKVLCDSDRDASLMENHLSRPEIQQSLLEGTGWSMRFSDTLKEDLLYAAKKVEYGNALVGFVRVAVPLTEVNRSINSLRLKINSAVLAVLLIAGLLLAWQAGKIRRFILQITEFSRSLARGSLDKKLFIEESGELGEIAQNLNAMSEELKNVIARNEEETDRLNVILKNIPDALLIINTHGITELSNDTAKEFFGNVPLRGRPFLEVVRNSEFFTLMDEVRQNRAAGFKELKLDYPKERYLSVRISPLFYREGELSGYIALFHDTTQMKRLEETRKDFVANVSHEIKTPVTAIQGFAETLLDGALDDREHAENFLHTIKSHSERLNRLVDDLLTLSKIELGAIRIDKTNVNISDIVDSVLETLRPGAEAKGLSLTKALKADELEIFANRDRTIQILLNLVDNAIKFTGAGTVEIGSGKKEERLYLYVKDSGIGIPKKYLFRLGERFFRVDPSRSRALGGTGLGLAIVKHLVRAQGWEMQIESEEGKGTTVRVYVS